MDPYFNHASPQQRGGNHLESSSCTLFIYFEMGAKALLQSIN
jgi:hypothetical protein